MKKVLLFSVLSVLVLIGCQKKNIEMSKTSVTLHHGETYQIDATSKASISYLTEDRYYADVNEKGLVTANCVGETNILLNNGKDEKKLHVTVEPVSNVITDPKVTIGQNKASILDRFGQADNEQSFDNMSALAYLYTDYATVMMFVFDENEKLVGYTLGGMINIAEDMKVYLSERYIGIGNYTLTEGYEGDAYINALTQTEASLKIVHLLVEGQMSLAVYSTPEYMDAHGENLVKKGAKFSQMVNR